MGRAVSNGLAKGTVVKLERPKLEIPNEPCQEAAACLDTFEAALDAAKNDLLAIQEKAKGTLDEAHLAIFDAHLQMVDDLEIVKQVKEKINARVHPMQAYFDVTEHFIAMFQAMDDAYFKERAADVKDIQTRVLAHMAGTPLKDLALLQDDTIIVAHDLTPSDTASLDLGKVKGFVTEIGGYTSHTAIMARAFGLPAVVGCDGIMALKDGDLILLNGHTGEVVSAPSLDALKAFDVALDKELKAEQAKAIYKTKKGLSKDHVSVPVYANIGSASDLSLVTENGAEGIGLFRTEFLFMESTNAPSLDAQIKAYTEVFKTGLPVIVRTLDIGGDKALPYITMPPEDNPFLGVRAIRLCLIETDLFKTQLKALLMAAEPFDDVRIMFPMIARVDELLAAKALLHDVIAELTQADIPYQTRIKVGIMIEIPAAALNVKALARHVDFFSIGTNDLMQYTYAADRMNERVSYLYEPFDPTFLRLLATTVHAAHAAHTEIGVCGEMAADSKAAVLLAGMGLDELSMSASRLLDVKETLARYSFKAMETLAQKALACDTAEEVLRLFE